MTASPKSQIAMREFGMALRKLRTEKTTLQQAQVGARVQRGQHWISRVENGRALPTRDELTALLDLFDVDNRARGRLEGMWEQAANLSDRWYDHPRFNGVFTEGMDIFGFEDAATEIRTFGGNFVPGLLQAEEYVKGLAEFAREKDTPKQREAFLEARELRTEVVTRRGAPIIHAMMLEVTLHAAVGGTVAHRAQLRHLLEVSERHNVHLRVIPNSEGAPALYAFPFSLFDFGNPDVKPVASRSLAKTVVFTDRPGEIRDLRRLFDRLAQYALSPEDTRDLIKKVMPS
jgi:transcriptional regulator with XRE-family HTH domain